MRQFQLHRSPLLFAASLVLGALFLPAAVRAQTVSKTGTAGTYSVTLRVLPAESFTGPHAEMAWDGGAAADTLTGADAPNHHMVAFIKKGGKSVENATVAISYRLVSAKDTMWIALPVARMHVAGKDATTTHFGNNVKLAAGNYEVRVTVNGEGPATFRITVTGAK